MSENVDLGEMRARADAATSGPWAYSDVIDNQHNVTRNKWDVAACSGGDLDPDGGDRDAQAARNAEFVAHARADIPALCDEVERLRAERDQWRNTAYSLDECLAERDAVIQQVRECARAWTAMSSSNEVVSGDLVEVQGFNLAGEHILGLVAKVGEVE